MNIFAKNSSFIHYFCLASVQIVKSVFGSEKKVKEKHIVHKYIFYQFCSINSIRRLCCTVFEHFLILKDIFFLFLLLSILLQEVKRYHTYISWLQLFLKTQFHIGNCCSKIKKILLWTHQSSSYRCLPFL